MKKTIYFVRHAESKTNIDPLFEGEDILSESGRVQALSVAPRFQKLNIEKIYTSNILRARLTGDEISKITGVESVACDFLGERKGSFSDDTTYFYTESFDVLMERMNRAKHFLEDETSAQHIVIVSHTIFLKSFAMYLLLGSALTEEVLYKVESSLVMDNTGVSKFLFDTEKQKWRMCSWNDLAHLAE